MNQTDPFASVRVGGSNQTESKPIPVEQQEMYNAPSLRKEDDFSSVRMNQQDKSQKPKESPSESPISSGLGDLPRHLTRSASRALETIIGIPGDISSILQSGLHYGAEKLLGPEKGSKIREHVNIKHTPTSGELEEFSKKVSSGYTEPQGDIEKASDEFVKTATSLLGPMKFRRALGVAAGSQLAKEGIGIAGFDENAQEAGKLGTMFMLSTINPKGALNYSAKKFKEAEALAKGASINASGLEKSLTTNLESLSKGISTPGKNSIIKSSQDLLNKISKGKIAIDDLMAAKRDINDLMGDPALLVGTKKLLKGLGRQVDQAIVPYEKVNPKFSKAFRPANEIYGAVMQGNRASNFIKKTLGAKSVMSSILTEAALGAPEAILPTAGGVAAIHGAAKFVDFANRLRRSPELRKYYQKALVAAAAEDTASLRLYADKIDKEFTKTNP